MSSVTLTGIATITSSMWFLQSLHQCGLNERLCRCSQSMMWLSGLCFLFHHTIFYSHPKDLKLYSAYAFPRFGHGRILCLYFPFWANEFLPSNPNRFPHHQGVHWFPSLACWFLSSSLPCWLVGLECLLHSFLSEFSLQVAHISPRSILKVPRHYSLGLLPYLQGAEITSYFPCRLNNGFVIFSLCPYSLKVESLHSGLAYC